MPLLRQLILTIFLLTLFLAPQPVYAQGRGRDGNSSGITCDESVLGVATIQSIRCILIRLLNFLPPIIILGTIIMIILGGAKMITGADDPKAYASAKQTITYAVIGLIGIAGAWIILLLIQAFTGANVTELNTLTAP